jgi:hypothetical protein
MFRIPSRTARRMWQSAFLSAVLFSLVIGSNAGAPVKLHSTTFAIGDHLWSSSYGDTGWDGGFSVWMDTDGSGNVIATGGFESSIDFGGGALTGGWDIYLAKLNPSGGHVWSASYGSPFSIDVAWDVTVDGSNNIVLSGMTEGGLDFGGFPLDGACYLAKFNTGGTHVWSQSFPMTSNSIFNEVDGTGNIIVAGFFPQVDPGPDVDFGGGVLADAFSHVAKFNSSGSHLWSAPLGDTLNQVYVRSVAADGSDNILLAGSMSAGTVNFGGGNLVGPGIVLVKLTGSGNHIWSKRFGDGLAIQEATAVAVDGANNIVITGNFGSTVDFGGGGLSSGPIFLAKFNSAGAHIWSQQYQGEAYAVDVTTAGEIAIGGVFTGTIDLGGGTLSSGPGADIFLARFDSSGAHQWSANFGNNTNSQFFYRAVFDVSGDLVATGPMEGSVDFGGGALTNAGKTDLFIAKFDGPEPTAVLDTPGANRLSMTAHPNPFNPQTLIKYHVADPGPISIGVYDLRGVLLDVLLEQHFVPAGTYEIEYAPSGRASGIYFVRIVASGKAHSKKIVLVK